ncbi:hypothetical protein [Crateriforma conspicua]|nr:hypothetical protein [Crateriforma conspicua]
MIGPTLGLAIEAVEPVNLDIQSSVLDAMKRVSAQGCAFPQMAGAGVKAN